MPECLIDPSQSCVSAFRQGALTNILNPKVALFFLAFLPQFLSRDGGPYWAQSLILGAAFDLSGTTINLLMAASAGRLAGQFRRDQRWMRGINWFAGSVICGLAAKLSLARRP